MMVQVKVMSGLLISQNWKLDWPYFQSLLDTWMVGYNIQQTAFRGQQVLLWVTFAVLDDRQNQFTPWRKFFYILLLFFS